MLNRLPRASLAVGLALALAGPSLTPTLAWAQGASVHEATEEQKAEAQVKFIEARRAFDDRRFVDAIAGFRSSFDVVASPNTHLMIAHAMRELGRYAEAYTELEGVAREASEAAKVDDKYQSTVELAREEMELLRDKIALLTVTIPSPEPGASLTVGSRIIPEDRWSSPIAIDPGNVTVIYQGSGEPIVKQVQAEAGGEAAVTLERVVEEPPPPPPQPVTPPDEGYQWQWTGTQRYIAYGVAGLGAAALITSAVTGGLAASKHSELEDACGDSPCPERQSDIDSGKTLMTTTNVLIIAGAVLVGGGVALYFTAPDEDAGDAGVTALRVGPGSLSVEGRF